jgi:predicted DNA-binding transcriptional regulator YafY
MNRQFEILYMLINKKNTTAKILAEYFGVSQRTIYRDIDNLCLAGVPIYTGKGKGGGISLIPEFTLDKSILNEHEQDEILTALQGLTSVRAMETENIIKKLSASFNKKMVNWLEVDFSRWDKYDEKLFKDIKTSILERRIVEFDYYSSNNEKIYRIIQPVQLWFKTKTWYLKGFCLTKHSMRIFKLTRIKKFKITNKYFTVRHLKESDLYINHDEYEKRAITIKLKIAPEMSYRVYDEFGIDLPEKQPDGSFIVSLVFPEDNLIYGIILSYGEYIEVLAPEHIRKIIKEKSIKITEKYL